MCVSMRPMANSTASSGRSASARTAGSASARSHEGNCGKHASRHVSSSTWTCARAARSPTLWRSTRWRCVASVSSSLG
eukprot:68826-Prymnesium_polylepis.1